MGRRRRPPPAAAGGRGLPGANRGRGAPATPVAEGGVRCQAVVVLAAPRRSARRCDGGPTCDRGASERRDRRPHPDVERRLALPPPFGRTPLDGPRPGQLDSARSTCSGLFAAWTARACNEGSGTEQRPTRGAGRTPTPSSSRWSREAHRQRGLTTGRACTSPSFEQAPAARRRRPRTRCQADDGRDAPRVPRP
jgi:hypothetical protein